MPDPIVFADWKAKKLAEQAVPVTLSDGSIMTVPPVILWPEPLLDADGNPTEKNDEWAVRIVGAEEWAKFKADGGDWLIMNAIIKEQKGLDSGN